MINSKELKTVSDFEKLKKGDFVACEFYRNIHDYPKLYRFKVFSIVKVKTDTKEVILQTKNNIYFNYQMFVNGESNLKSAILLNCYDNIIPTQKENPSGLHQRYILSKINGQPISETSEYFVLRLDFGGNDHKHINACRKAVLTYANEIKGHLPKLSNDLIDRYGS